MLRKSVTSTGRGISRPPAGNFQVRLYNPRTKKLQHTLAEAVANFLLSIAVDTVVSRAIQDAPLKSGIRRESKASFQPLQAAGRRLRGLGFRVGTGPCSTSKLNILCLSVNRKLKP